MIIVILPCAHGPYESREEDHRDGGAGCDQEKDDGHQVLLLRSQKSLGGTDDRVTLVRGNDDLRQVLERRPTCLAAKVTAIVTKPTTVTLLRGMRMAAIKGVSLPATAKETPVML